MTSFKDLVSGITTKANDTARLVQFQAKKNAPLLMTVGGVAGLGLTAYLAYKSRDKIVAITEEVEEMRERGEEVPTMQVLGRVGTAIAAPVCTGILSIGMITGSYVILSGRNKLLAGALSSALDENGRLKRRIKEEYPEAITAPVDEVTDGVTINEEGREEIVKTAKVSERPSLEGVWFNKSQEYIDDDHQYNMAFIKSKAEILDNKLRRTGFLTLNEVYSILNIPKSEVNYRVGSMVGWTDGVDGNYFDLESDIVMVTDPDDGYAKPQIYVHWPEVTSLYDKGIDFSEGFENYVY